MENQQKFNSSKATFRASLTKEMQKGRRTIFLQDEVPATSKGKGPSTRKITVKKPNNPSKIGRRNKATTT